MPKMNNFFRLFGRPQVNQDNPEHEKIEELNSYMDLSMNLIGIFLTPPIFMCIQ